MQQKGARQESLHLKRYRLEQWINLAFLNHQHCTNSLSLSKIKVQKPIMLHRIYFYPDAKRERKRGTVEMVIYIPPELQDPTQ